MSEERASVGLSCAEILTKLTYQPPTPCQGLSQSQGRCD